MLHAPVRRFYRGMNRKRRKRPAAQTGGTTAPLLLSPSVPLTSPSSAQLRLSGPNGWCRLISPPPLSLSQLQLEEVAKESFILKKCEHKTSIILIQKFRERIKIFILFFFCIVFVIRWRRRVPAYLHFAYYYCILYFAYYSYLHLKFFEHEIPWCEILTPALTARSSFEPTIRCSDHWLV
jgi:hypothetical protein